MLLNDSFLMTLWVINEVNFSQKKQPGCYTFTADKTKSKIELDHKIGERERERQLIDSVSVYVVENIWWRFSLNVQCVHVVCCVYGYGKYRFQFISVRQKLLYRHPATIAKEIMSGPGIQHRYSSYHVRHIGKETKNDMLKMRIE